MDEECEVADTNENYKKSMDLWALALHQSKTQLLLLAKHLFLLHNKYVIVSVNKAPNNIVFVCQSHYVDCLIKALGIDISFDNPTYTPTTHTKEEILDNHRSVIYSFGIPTKDEELDLQSLYWIPKLHTCPFKQTYIDGSAQLFQETSFKIINMYSISGH